MRAAGARLVECRSEAENWMGQAAGTIYRADAHSEIAHPRCRAFGRVLCQRRHTGRGAKRQSSTHSDGTNVGRSEEHTSELQSLMRISYAVFCLKKKKQKNQMTT